MWGGGHSGQVDHRVIREGDWWSESALMPPDSVVFKPLQGETSCPSLMTPLFAELPHCCEAKRSHLFDGHVQEEDASDEAHALHVAHLLTI